MRGIAYDRFGGEDVLQLRDDLPEPPVGPDTVLVRVHAAGVNPVDLTIRAGHLAGAYPHHFPIIPGWDVAGVVEAVGPAVVALRARRRGVRLRPPRRRPVGDGGGARARAAALPGAQAAVAVLRRGRAPCRWPG